MADFRILLPDTPDDHAQRELDWGREAGIWTLSVREYGSSRWNLEMVPSAWDLDQVLVFFRMVRPVREDVLRTMAPGDCVLAHAGQVGTKDIVADLCLECGEHWLVYRLDDDGQWRLYGRTCGYSWHRGRPVQVEENEVLAGLLGTAL